MFSRTGALYQGQEEQHKKQRHMMLEAFQIRFYVPIVRCFYSGLFIDNEYTEFSAYEWS